MCTLFFTLFNVFLTLFSLFHRITERDACWCTPRICWSCRRWVKSRRPTRPSRPGFRSKRVSLRCEDTSTWQSFIDDPEFDKQTEPGDILALLLGQVFTRKIAAVHGSPQQGKSYTCDSGTLTKCKAVPACFASFMASNARICAGSRTT